MTRREWTWCLGYAAVLSAVTTLPYLLGFAAQDEGWRFSGFVFGVQDGNSYIAKMLQGSAGAWLFRTPYSAREQQGVVAFLPYLLLGKLASGEGLHDQLVALFHCFRLVATGVAAVGTYLFCAAFLHEERSRRWGTILGTAGGGLGWVAVLAGQSGWLGSLPLDLHSPESFGFLASFGLPHLALARGLLLGGLAAYLRSDARPRLTWLAGGLWLVLGLVQPLSVVSGYFVLAAHGAALAIRAVIRREAGEWRAWSGRGLRTVLVSAPVVVYTYAAFSTDPFLRGWTEQNRIFSPHPLHYLLAYAVVLVPAVMGGWAHWRKGGSALLPVSWAAVLPLLAYFPHNLQRRLPEGVWVALVVLAATGLTRTSGHRRRWAESLLLVASLPTTAILLAGGLGAAVRQAEPVFTPAPAAAAYQWMAAHAYPGSVVLSSFDTGNELPAWAPVRVVIGHGPESADLETLEPQVRSFYAAATTDADRKELLEAQRVEFVFWGPRERSLGSWNPETAAFLQLEYQEAGVSVYRVGCGCEEVP